MTEAAILTSVQLDLVEGLVFDSGELQMNLTEMLQTGPKARDTHEVLEWVKTLFMCQ